MYDFDVESIQDLREFIDFNRDMKLKKDRNIIYFAVQNWTLEGVKSALQMIQNRPCWNWEEVRATITTYFWYHQDEVPQIQEALKNALGDKPVVVCRLINLELSLKQIEKKFNSF